MAKKLKETAFLKGTFIGVNSKGERVTLLINDYTAKSKIETFIKDNPILGKRITDKALIEEQDSLINRNK